MEVDRDAIKSNRDDLPWCRKFDCFEISFVLKNKARRNKRNIHMWLGSKHDKKI